jgi:hypothetical protein
VAGELAAGGRLAGALEAGHEDHGGRLAREDQVATGAAHQRGQLLVHELDDLLPRVQRLEHLGARGALLHLRGELLDDVEVDVGLEQREPHLSHRLRDVLLGELTAPLDVGQGGLEPVGEGLEHAGLEAR